MKKLLRDLKKSPLTVILLHSLWLEPKLCKRPVLALTKWFRVEVSFSNMTFEEVSFSNMTLEEVLSATYSKFEMVMSPFPTLAVPDIKVKPCLHIVALLSCIST